jgi:hypothetical protein
VAADSLKGTKVGMESDDGGSIDMFSRYNDMNDSN